MTHSVVSHAQWLEARKAFLAKEKEFTHLRDELAAKRRELPWERVDKAYGFDAAEGRVSLADLFGKHSQLLVYHFMYGTDWTEGCPSCSFWADNYNGVDIHLAHRDTALVVVSLAPLAKLDAYKKRLGWSFRWVSSAPSDFNVDFNVTLPVPKGDKANYNYDTVNFGTGEAPGLSAFRKGDDGAIYHTYSTYSRGLDMFNGTYHMLDLTSKGRDEAGLPWPMAWVRRHDSY